MPKTVGAESIQSVSISPTEEEEFYDYEFYFSVFAKTEFFNILNSNSAGERRKLDSTRIYKEVRK